MEKEDPPDFISCTCMFAAAPNWFTSVALLDFTFFATLADLELVGEDVGDAVGAIDGGAVGDAVGAIDGGAVGDAVGAVEGDLVGLIEGDEVGSFVGAPGHCKFESTTFQHSQMLMGNSRLQMAPVPNDELKAKTAPEHTDASNKPPLSSKQ